MDLFRKKDALEEEWEKISAREFAYLKKRQLKRENILNQKLSEVVPAKLQDTLNKGFAGAFALIFEKGTDFIEKTYNKKEKEDSSKINHYAASVRQNRKSLRSFSKKSNVDGAGNLLLSGASGVGMGLCGVGLPDIPLFTAMILRSIYETALNYGFSYEDEEERYFILLLIQGAMSYEGELLEINSRLNQFIMHGKLPAAYERTEHISQTAKLLSQEMLYMKFLQGIPLVGAVGGAYDAVYMKQIVEYANLKYRQRILYQMKEGRKAAGNVVDVDEPQKARHGGKI